MRDKDVMQYASKILCLHTAAQPLYVYSCALYQLSAGGIINSKGLYGATVAGAAARAGAQKYAWPGSLQQYKRDGQKVASVAGKA